jgi:LuxR family quorum sensing-dependent transcriptional regulator
VTHFLQLALDVVERVDATPSIAAAAAALLDGLRPMGGLALNLQDTSIVSTIGGRRSVPPLAVIVPDGYVGSAAQVLIDTANPNPAAARALRRPFLWREARLPTKSLHDAYWEALGSFGAVEGLAVTDFERGRRVGVSLAFATADWSPEDRRAMEFACYALIDKVRQLSPRPSPPPRLTPRERDCLAFVGEGKTDWEISTILGISQSTTHQYVESARKKLGAATRAQAVACFLIAGFQ